MDIPLFPLHTVLCPGVALPLHIFEARYRLMIGRCLAEDRPFGVVWIRDGREVGPGELAVAAVGTLAEIREADRYADGRYDLVALGTGRFRIGSVDAASEPYLVADVEPLDEPLGDADAAGALARRVTRRFVRYVDLVREVEARQAGGPVGPRGDSLPGARSGPAAGSAASPDESTDDVTPEVAADRSALAIPVDPTLLSHLLAGIVELDPRHRQALLEAPTVETRLEALDELLGRETAYLERGLRVVRPMIAVGMLSRN
jgi:Lon protease-like protein